jgi:hypothetical protein
MVSGMPTLFLLTAAVWALHSPVLAHSDEQGPINLQVLPLAIEHQDLMEVMAEFTEALGVGCDHCHVQIGDGEERFDYVADDLETKAVAREMMLMTQVINEELLPLTGRGDLMLQVTCTTCHHGQRLPRTLESALMEKFTAAGVDASVAEYDRLRQRHYGRAVYDFGEGTLLSMARRLRKAREGVAEQRILELNLKHFPQSYMTHSQMASHWEARGDTSAALVSYEEALRLSGYSWFKEQVERLRRPQ